MQKEGQFETLEEFARDAATIIQVMGLHLGAKLWAKQAIGDREQGLGRVATALYWGTRLSNARMRFGTGASSWAEAIPDDYADFLVPKYVPPTMKEAEVTQLLARANLDLLIDLLPRERSHTRQIHNLLKDADLELSATNTLAEVRSALVQCGRSGARQCLFVSGPNHIQRVMTDAYALAESCSTFRRIVRNSLFVASDVPYAGATVRGTIVFEPPHRGDDTLHFYYECANELMQLRRSTLYPLEDVRELISSILALIATFKRMRS
jgi:hypothetical protein